MILESLGLPLWGTSVILAVIIGLAVWPQYLIMEKAGYKGWWALLVLIPVVGWVMIWVFAFRRWPVLGKE